MSEWMAAVLGIVEGLTEYLPVSSTGHLILVGTWLGAASEAAKSFDIVIQLGAILAVVVHYRALLWERIGGVIARRAGAPDLFVALAIAFAPAAVAGLLLRKTIKQHLFGPVPVAAALIVGGVVMIGVERWRARRSRAARGAGASGATSGAEGLDQVTPRRALAIGLGQCLSLWPGASRSMCTIVAGQLSGLSTATAAEFSFLLALPTLGAATLYELYKSRHELLGATGAGAGTGGTTLAIGLVTSFAVAWGVIAAFVKYLQRRGLEPFGYYRIVLGAVVLWVVYG